MTKKIVALFLALTMLMGLATVTQAETLEGVAAGRNGDVKVFVTLEDGIIQSVEVTEHQETAGIADPAIERIPASIVKRHPVGG